MVWLGLGLRLGGGGSLRSPYVPHRREAQAQPTIEREESNAGPKHYIRLPAIPTPLYRPLQPLDSHHRPPGVVRG